MSVVSGSKTAASSGRVGAAISWRSVRVSLAVCVTLAFAAYIWWTIRSANQARCVQSMEANMVLAQLAGRVIDSHCSSVQSALLVVSRENLSAKPEVLSASVRELTHQIAAVSVQVYDAEGIPLQSYPSTSRNELTVKPVDEAMDFLARIDRSGRAVYVEGGQSATELKIAAAVTKDDKPQVLAIASYSPQIVEDWLKPVWNEPDRVFYVVDSKSRLIASSHGEFTSGASVAFSKVLTEALAGAGTSEDSNAGGEPTLIGYAPASIPHWAVLVGRPVRDELAPLDHLKDVVLGEALLIAGILLLSSWLWDRHIQRRGSKFPALAGQQLKGERLPQADRSSVVKRSSGDSSDPPSPHTARRSELGTSDVIVPPMPSVANDPSLPLSDTIFVSDGLWKCASVSVRGTSHVKTGQPCQDASYCKVLNGNLLLAAVADGAGSAPSGDKGAQTAARLAVESLATHAVALKPSDSDEQWNRLLFSAMGVARGHVEAVAAVRNQSTRQLATTLILLAAAPELVVVAQIGDGAVVLQDHRNLVRALSRPSHGEYINTTTFLVSPDALKSVQQNVWRGPYSHIAAFSDGLQMLALTMPEGNPHPPFFAPLFSFLESSTDGGKILTQLSGFLRSDKVTNRSDDDLTLMLATLTK